MVIIKARTSQQGLSFQVGAGQGREYEGMAHYPETSSPLLRLLRAIPLELEFAIGKQRKQGVIEAKGVKAMRLYKDCPILGTRGHYYTTNAGGEVILSAKTIAGLKQAIDDNDKRLEDSRQRMRRS